MQCLKPKELNIVLIQQVHAHVPLASRPLWTLIDGGLAAESRFCAYSKKPALLTFPALASAGAWRCDVESTAAVDAGRRRADRGVTVLHLHQRNGLSNICKLLRRKYDAAMLEAWSLWALRDAELAEESLLQFP